MDRWTSYSLPTDGVPDLVAAAAKLPPNLYEAKSTDLAKLMAVAQRGLRAGSPGARELSDKIIKATRIKFMLADALAQVDAVIKEVQEGA